LKKKRLILAFLVIAFILLTSVACSKSTPTTAKTSEYQFKDGKLTKEFSLKVVKGGAFDYCIADMKGFLKDVGIVTDYQGPLKGGTLAQAVVQGNVDLMHSGHVIDIALARKAGMKIKFVLEGMVDSPDADKGHMFYFVKDDGKINSVQDLVGKKIGVSSLGSCVEVITDEYLRQNGIGKDKVQLVVMPDAQMEQALRQGMIDVAVLHQPFSFVARQKPGLKVLVSSYAIGAVAGDGEASGLAVRAFSEDFLKKNPDVVKAYITADVRGQRWSNQNFEEAKKLYAQFNGTPVSGGNWTPTEKWVDVKKVQFWISMLERNGFLKPGEVKAEDLFTNDLNPFFTGELKE